MQNMHKTTYDGPLTGVNWPIHRGARRRAKAVVYITARGLGSVIDGSVCPGAGFQQDYGDRFSSTLLLQKTVPVELRITINHQL